jgi:anti-sigma regulatory factor (Ser/Thr protein kinase)
LTPLAPPPHASGPVADYSLRAHAAEIPNVSAWLGEVGAARGIPPEPLWRLDLCMTEALANIIDHGGERAAAHPISLGLAVRGAGAAGEAALVISDGGAAFDPVTAPAKPLAATLAEAEPGGQGLVLMRRFADALDYAFREGRNQLTIGVRWSADAERVSR